MIAKAKTEGDIRHPPPLEVARAESGALAVEAKAGYINKPQGQNHGEYHQPPTPSLYVLYVASGGGYKYEFLNAF